MNLYDVNKTAYATISTISESERMVAWNRVAGFIADTENRCYMLLNHDTRYFTLFRFNQEKDSYAMVKELFEIVESLGEIKGVNAKSTEGAVEFWITNPDDETYMYLFFPYDAGVINIE